MYDTVKTVCAWHKLYFPSEPEAVIVDGPTKRGQVSHGMCKRCLKIFTEKNNMVKKHFNRERIGDGH